jgi:hypothetical protein
MGTNFYRIPTESEMIERKARLTKMITDLDVSPAAVCQGFTYDNPNGFDRYSPWDIFTEDIEVHLGKRSGGWKFCWNFHKNRYYSNKESLESFVRSGRIIDEYGTEFTADEFLEMAYNWCPDGWSVNAEYEREQIKKGGHTWGPSHYDLEIEGLRVSSSSDFS